MSDGLTDKQRVFVHEYLKDWNATRAAIAAGYSEKTAKEIGCENLTKPNIQKYIEEAQSDIQKVAGIGTLSNIEHLKRILANPETADRDKIKAIEVLNKMLGLNSAEKHEVKSNVLNISFTKTNTPPITSENDLYDDD